MNQHAAAHPIGSGFESFLAAGGFSPASTKPR